MMLQLEGKTLNKALLRQAITRNLKNPKGNYYVVAYDNNDPEKIRKGSAGVTHRMSVELGGLICEGHAVYVSPDARRHGAPVKIENFIRQ